MSQSLKADLVLVFITLSWGITFPLIARAVQTVSPYWFVSIRFFIASIVLLPFLCKEIKFTTKHLLKSGAVLGVFNAGAYLAQTMGMKTVDAAHAATITGASVIIVPFLLPFFALGKPKITDVISAVFCLVGLTILTKTITSHFSLGDGWILLCTFFVALSIVYLQKSSTNIKHINLLAFYQITFTFPLPMIIWLFSAEKSFIQVNLSVVIAVIFCAVVATSIALLLQTRYQRFTTATRAAMIFLLEPVFGVFFGCIINNDKISWHIIIGTSIIILSILFSIMSAKRDGMLCGN